MMHNTFDPRQLSLVRYDSEAFGPLFAVSDEGSAGSVILEAAYASAKAKALWPLDPVDLGVALDGERMTSAGETPIGPPEYEELLAAAAGKLICTTNVGVRVNTRLSQQPPEIHLADTPAQESDCVGNILSTFAPFVQTPDRRPRPLTVRLVVMPEAISQSLKPVLAKLDAARNGAQLGPAETHRISLLADFRRPIGEDEMAALENLLLVAADAGVPEVAVDATPREASRQRVMIPSLLNILDETQLNRLLKTAKRHQVQLTYRYRLDVDSAARTIWTGLHSARSQGFTAGKFGMVPLTLEEQAVVMELVLRWMAGWSAIPAFYVDTPLETDTEVFEPARCEQAARVWLKAARGAGATLVLFDAPDRVTPRKLVSQPEVKGDSGVLTIDAIGRLAAYARELGVSILWSGGITAPQAFALAKLRVAGIFSTSSTAAKIAVTAELERDPRLPAENEPTEFGVRRIHAIVQGGFLAAALKSLNEELATAIESGAQRLVAAEQDPALAADALGRLNLLLLDGWRKLARTRESSGPPLASMPAVGNPAAPVPANAVRVFRGRKRADLPRDQFINKLATIFMPVTVQMQRLYGLGAYLPALPPENARHDLPDEVALVFYRTQGCYHEAKRCVGGRAYSAMHDLVFDMKASGSAFPELFAGTLDLDKPYHLFERSVDWQTGDARIYLGTLRAEVPAEKFAQSIRDTAAELQRSPEGVDAVVLCCGKEWLVWWEHAPVACSAKARFGDVADTVLATSARRLSVPPVLTSPYSGLALKAGGDYVNLLFPRV